MTTSTLGKVAWAVVALLWMACAIASCGSEHVRAYPVTQGNWAERMDGGSHE